MSHTILAEKQMATGERKLRKRETSINDHVLFLIKLRDTSEQHNIMIQRLSLSIPSHMITIDLY